MFLKKALVHTLVFMMAASPVMSQTLEPHFRLGFGAWTSPPADQVPPGMDPDSVRGEGDLSVWAPLQVRGRIDRPFNLRVGVENQEGLVAWSSIGNALPDGLTLDQSGLISGVPQRVQYVPDVVIKGEDQMGKEGTTRPFRIDVPPLPQISMSSSYAFSTGNAVDIRPTTQHVYGSQVWTASASLPGGLRLDSASGRIHGVVEQAGSFQGLTLSVTDGDGAQGTTNPFAIEVTAVFTVSGFEDEYKIRTDQSFETATPWTTGTSNPVQWSLAPSSDPLPTGLALDAGTGRIHGTPQAPLSQPLSTGPALVADARVVVRGTDAVTGDISGSPTMSIKIADDPQVAGPAVTNAMVGRHVSVAPTANHVLGTPFWTFQGVLPPGTGFSQTTGVISGVPQAAGVYDVTATVRDLHDGAMATSTPLRIVVAPELDIVAIEPTLARVGLEFANAAPVVRGLQGTAVYSLQGTLPVGLSFSTLTGEITGTPSAAGYSAPLVIGVADMPTGAVARSEKFFIRVLGENEPIDFAVANVAEEYHGRVGTTFLMSTGTVNARGPVAWSLSGALPSWASFNPQTGSISGNPVAAGTTSGLRLTATELDSGLTAQSAAFAIAIAPAGIFSVSLETPLFVPAEASFEGPAPVVANAPGTVTFSLSAGMLPQGLSLASGSGVISGTATEVGTFDNLVLQASAAGRVARSNPFTLEVGSALPPGMGGNDAGVAAGIAANATGAVGLPFLVEAWQFGLNAPVTWSVAEGALPSWVSLDPASGALAGTPNAAAVHGPFVLRASSSGTLSARTNAFYISVVKDPVLSASMAPALLGRVGTGFSVTPNVSFVSGSATWTAVGEFPPGLAVDPQTGTVFGVPTQTGAFQNLRLAVSDSSGASAQTGAFRIDVSGQAGINAAIPAFLGAALNHQFAAQATAFGATAPLTWTVVQGALPPGLQIGENSGLIEGSPSQTGLYANIRLSVTDAQQRTALTNTFSINVTLSGIAMGGLPTPQTGAYDVPFASPAPQVVNATAPLTFSLATGTLPTWAALNSATGVISGVPDRAGTTSNISIAVTDADNRLTISNPFSIVVTRDALSASMGTDRVGARVAHPMTGPAPEVRNAIGNITWVPSKPLPSGLIYSVSTGRITGTPSSVGVHPDYRMIATDQSDGSTSTTEPFEIEIVAEPKIYVSSSYTARLSTPFLMQPQGIGLIGDRTWSLASGTLPSWASLNALTGAISGTPNANGSFHGLSLRVQEASGSFAVSGQFSVVVTNALTATISETIVEGRVSVGFAFAGAASNDPNVTWRVATGELPAWASLNPVTGAIAGTPNAPSATVLALEARDPSGFTKLTPAFTLIIRDRPQLAVGNIATRVNTPFSYAPAANNVMGQPTWSFVDDVKPAWLTLDPATGSMSGTPTQTQLMDGLRLRVVDGQGVSGTSAPFSIAVTTGIDFTYASYERTIRRDRPMQPIVPTLTNTRGGGVAWTTTGTLPEGVYLSPGQGSLSGAPLANGVYTFPVTVTDAVDGSRRTRNVTLTVIDPLEIGQIGPTVVRALNEPASIPAPGVSGAIGQLSWMVVAGTLPSWASFSVNTGATTGTPQESTTSRGLVLRVVDAFDGAEALSNPFNLFARGDLDVTDMATLYQARFGFPFESAAPTMVNAIGDVTWQWAAGSNPPSWLFLDQRTGVMTGVPNALATTGGLRLVGTDAEGRTAPSVFFALEVSNQPSITVAKAQFKQRLGDTLQIEPIVNGVAGTATYALAVDAGTLPPGVSIHTQTGVVSGNPTATGSAAFRILLTDSAGGTAQTAPIALVVSPALALTGLGTYYEGKRGSYFEVADRVASGVVNAAEYTLFPSVPQGMTFADGRLTGVPTAAVSRQEYRIRLRDSYDGRHVDAAFDLRIHNTPQIYGTRETMLRNDVPASEHTFTPSTDGGAAIWSLGAGALPTGVSVDSGTGRLTGTPTGYLVETVNPGIRLRATFADETYALSPTFAITVATALTLSSPSALNARFDTPFSSQLRAMNAHGVVTWSVNGGSLPPGLTLSPSGLLTGSPEATGTFQATIRMQDSGGPMAESQLNVIVRNKLVVSVPSALVKATTGQIVDHLPSVSGVYGTVTWSRTMDPNLMLAGVNFTTNDGRHSSVVGTGERTVSVVLRATDSIDGAVALSVPVVFDSRTTMVIEVPQQIRVRTGEFRESPALVVGGASGPVTFSLFSGTMPPGLSVNPATGGIVGTPTSAFTARTLTVLANDGALTATRAFSIEGRDQLNLPEVPDIVFHRNGVPTTTYLGYLTLPRYGTTTQSTVTTFVPSANKDIVLAGGNAILFSSNDSARSSSQKGYINWRFQSAQSLNGIAERIEDVVLTVTDTWDGAVATSNPFAVNIRENVWPSEVRARVGGIVESERPVAVGFGGNPVWSATNLPAGLTINPMTGIISGIVAQAGTFSVTMSVTGNSQTATANVNVVVRHPIVIPVVSDYLYPVPAPGSVGLLAMPALREGEASHSDRWGFTVTGASRTTSDGSILSFVMGSSTTRSRVNLRLSASSGGIAPEQVRDLVFTVTDDWDGSTATSNPFTVSFYTMEASSDTNIRARVGVPHVHTLPQYQGLGDVQTWSIQSGTLPPGLTLDPVAGRVSGIATAVHASNSVTFRLTGERGSITVSRWAASREQMRWLYQPGNRYFNTEMTYSTDATMSATLGMPAYGNNTYSGSTDISVRVRWPGGGPASSFSIGGGSIQFQTFLTRSGAFGGTYREYGHFAYKYGHTSFTTPTAREGIVATVTDSWDGWELHSDPFNFHIYTLRFPSAVNARVGEYYESGLPIASGFPGDITWSISSGTLPAGLRIEPLTGRIVGVAQEAIFNRTVHVRAQGGGVTGIQTLTVNTRAALQIATVPNLVINVSESHSHGSWSNFPTGAIPSSSGSLTANQTLTTHDGNTIDFRQSSSSIQWRVLRPNTTSGTNFMLSQTPQRFNNVVLTLTDYSDGKTVQSNPFDVILARIEVPEVRARVGIPYQGAPAAVTGLPGAPIWSRQSGSLGTGLTVDPVTGTVSGTPPSTVTGNVTYRVTTPDGIGLATRPATVGAALVAPTVAAVLFNADETFTNNVVGTIGSLSGARAAVAITPVNGILTGNGTNIGFELSGSTLRHKRANSLFAANATISFGGIPRHVPGYVLTLTDTWDGSVVMTNPFDVSVFTMSGIENRTAPRNVYFETPAPEIEGIPGVPTWTVVNSTLQTGLNVNPATGVISGTPTLAASRTLRLRATFPGGRIAESTSFILTVQ